MRDWPWGHGSDRVKHCGGDMRSNLRCGAVPQFVDIGAETYIIDPNKLEDLKKDNQRRLTIAEYYTKNLQQTSLKPPYVADNVLHAFHQYVVRSTKRDQLREALKAQRIGTLIHYPMPIHKQPAYKKYNVPGGCTG